MQKQKINTFFPLSLPVLLAILSLVSVIIYNSRYPNEPDDLYPVEEIIPEEVMIRYVYQIPADSFRIENGKVQRNHTFSVLLSNLGISPEIISRSLSLASDIFDARRFRAGNNYAVFYQTDSLDQSA